MNTPSADARTIDLAVVMRSIRHRWRWVVAGLVVGLGIAVVLVVAVTPRFSAKATVVLKAPETGVGSFASKLGGSIANAANGMVAGDGLAATPIETETQILKSRVLAGEVADSLRLQLRLRSGHRQPVSARFDAVSFPGSFKPMRLEFTPTANAGFMVSGFEAPLTTAPGVPTQVGSGSFTLARSVPAQAFAVDVYDREDAITRLAKRLRVAKVGGEVLAIEYQGDDSLTAALVPNLLIRRYLVRRRTQDRGLNQRRAEFLSAQADSVDASLLAATADLRRQQEQSGVIDPVVVGRIDLERAGEMRVGRSALDLERGALTQLLAQLGSRQITPAQVAAFPTFLKSPGINELLSQLSALQTRRLQLLATLTPEEPTVVATTQSIEQVEREITALAKSYMAAIDRQRADLSQQLDTLQQAIERLPLTSEVAARWQRRVSQLIQVSTALRAQLVDARLATIGEGGDVRLLDAATAPRRPSFPRPLKMLAVGAGGGLAFGVLVALLLTAFGNRIRDPGAIEREFGLPVLPLDDSTPFIVASMDGARAVMLVPLDAQADTRAVGERLLRTSAARGLRGHVVDISEVTTPLGDIDRLTAEFDLTLIRTGALASDATLGALRPSCPVLFVASADGVYRTQLEAARDSLNRLGIVCAGLVLTPARDPRRPRA